MGDLTTNTGKCVGEGTGRGEHVSLYLPACCVSECVCVPVNVCASVCEGVCKSRGKRLSHRYLWWGEEPCTCVSLYKMSRLGGTAPFPSGTIFPERRGTTMLAPAQPRRISFAPPFVGIVWREGVSGLGTQERATGSSQGSSRPIKLGKQPPTPQCPSLAWSSKWWHLWGSHRPLSSEQLRPPQT